MPGSDSCGACFFYITRCFISITSVHFGEVEQNGEVVVVVGRGGALIRGASTNRGGKKHPPLGGMNEAQCIKRQADIAEARASCDETISAN